MSCPNKAYKSSENQVLSDWDILVDNVGEENAMAFFIQNNEEMPTIEQINAIILANNVLQTNVKNEESRLIQDLINSDKEGVVKATEDITKSAKATLKKLKENKKYETLKKLLTTENNINQYESVTSILDDANKVLDDEEGVIRKARGLGIYISETSNFIDLIRENVKDIVSDTENSYKNISTLQYHLYTLNDFKYNLKSIKDTFEGNKSVENKINKIIGNIDSTEKDILKNDVAGMVSAFKPYLAPISEKYLLPFKERLEKVEKYINKSKNPEEVKKYKKEKEALELKIKEFDVSTEENIAAFLKGERGDSNLASILLEAYSNNTNPVVASFTEWLKDNLNEVGIAVNKVEKEYLNELAPYDKILGKRFNPQTLAKQITQETEKLDYNGETYKVIEVLHEKNGTEKLNINGENLEVGYVKAIQIYEQKIEKLQDDVIAGVDVEVNKEKLHLLRVEYGKFKREYMNQEFTEEYYEKYDLLSDDIGQSLKEDMENIFSKIRELQIPLKRGLEISDEDYGKIDAYYDEYINLGSIYNIDGSKKEGAALKKAEKMKKVREFNRGIYTYKPDLQAFEKSKNKHSEYLISKGIIQNTEEYNIEMKKWEEKNTIDEISQDFYKIRKSNTDEIQELLEDIQESKNVEFDEFGSFKKNWEIINEGIYGHRDENGQPIGTEIGVTASKDIKESTLRLEEIKKRVATISGLSKLEFERLSDLIQRSKNLTIEEIQEMDELKKKRKEIGLSEASKNRLFQLFEQLKELQSKVPTEYYINAFNNISQKYSVFIDELGDFEGESILESSKLRKLLKENDFKEWFNKNHIEIDVYDSKTHTNSKKWVRLHQWSRIKPNDPKYITNVPGRKYSIREVKNEFKTGYNPTTKKVELEVGVHTDNKGNWLPKKGKFINKRYEQLKKSNDPKEKALFGLLGVHTKYLLKAQEELSNNNKLWLEIPRLLKTSTERNLILLNKLKEKPTDIPQAAWETIKAKWNAITNFSQGEGNFQQVFADKEGNQFTSVPIKYKDKMDVENVSLDLFRGNMKYTFSAYTNRKLIDIFPTANSLQRILGNPSYKPLDLLKKIVKKGISPKGSTNITAKAIDNIVKREFEGQEKKMELGKTGEKITSILKTATVLKTIAFDVPASTANVINAEAQMIINAGNGYTTIKNLGAAHAIFFKEYLPAFFNDYKQNKLEVNSLQSQIFDLYGFVSSHKLEDSVGEKYGQSKIKDFLALNWIKNHREWGEVFVQTLNGISFLDATKIEQELLDGSKKLITLNEAYELDSNGVIKLKEGVPKNWDLESFDTNRLKSLIKFANGRINGNYAKDIDKIEANTSTVYSTFFMMKNFFVEMLLNRTAGTDFRLSYGIKSNKRFNIKTGSDRGYLAEILNIQAEQLESYLKTGELYTLSIEEKIAIYKTISDVSVMIFAYFLMAYIFGFDYDDDDKWDKIKGKTWLEAQGVYQSARLLTESTTFENPYQWKDFLLSEPIVAKTVTDYLDLIAFTIGNLTNDPDSYYKKNYGIYKKGDSKAKAKLYKVTGVQKVVSTLGDEENSAVQTYMKLRDK